MERFRLEWCIADCTEVARPLVVMFPWVWAGTSYIQKYVRLCHGQGWDVLLVQWPMAAMWFPMWGRSMAYSVVEGLGNYLQQRGERPVVLYAFSGSAKGVLSSVLSLLAWQHPLSTQQASAVASVLRCCAGCIYDSCPVDFTSDAGKKLVAPQIFSASGGGINSSSSSSSSQVGYSTTSSSRLVGAAGRLARSTARFGAALGCDVAAGALDFFLLEWFEQDRAAMWTALRTPPIHGPLLFLYSRGDALVDAAQLADLAASLRLQGHDVVEQAWQDTPHCGHYRSHPEQYTDSVSLLLSKAMQEWSARSSRIREGRAWVASWQQDFAGQQQQQDLAGQQQRQYRGQTVWAGQWASRPLRHQQPEQQYHATNTDDMVDAQQQQQQRVQMQWQQQGEEIHREQQPQLLMQHTRGIMFGASRRQQQQQRNDRAAASQRTPGSSSSSKNKHSCNRSSSAIAGCAASSCRHGDFTTEQVCSTDSSTGSTNSQAQQQMRQPAKAAATGCCCSGRVLAAVTAAAVADTASVEVTRPLAASHVCCTSSSSSGGRGFPRMQQQLTSHKQQQQHQWRQQQQQRRRSTSRDLTSLVLLSHAAARSSGSGSSQKPCRADATAAAGVWPADTTAAAAIRLSGHALIGTCCGCEASECRCAETLAAASGEVVCSDSTTLSHSLRCMTSMYMGRQQQQQQVRYHSGSSSNISSVPLQSTDDIVAGVPVASSNKAAAAAAGTTAGWQQHQVQAMHQLHQQQQEPPFVQRVVSRLRSKL